jgi:hypothetical protein
MSCGYPRLRLLYYIQSQAVGSTGQPLSHDLKLKVLSGCNGPLCDNPYLLRSTERYGIRQSRLPVDVRRCIPLPRTTFQISKAVKNAHIPYSTVIPNLKPCESTSRTLVLGL